MTDPNVKPVAAAMASPTAPPLHGAMKAGQSVVYVLDCSGSMGEFGKLDVARAALVSTLHRQGGEVRFQVIAYNTTAKALLRGVCVPATVANVTATETALATLKATGRSNHAEAIRSAVALNPDVIVLLTDADDLTLDKLKPRLAPGEKSVPLCLVLVTADGASVPRELR